MPCDYHKYHMTTITATPQMYSPKMDILALALATGAVSLYRLHWQRIWSAPAAEEGRLASSLAWRPDGKLLACGDSGGLLTVHHIEAAAAIHSQQLDSRVTSLTWVSCPGDREGGQEDEWSFLARYCTCTCTCTCTCIQ